MKFLNLVLCHKVAKNSIGAEIRVLETSECKNEFVHSVVYCILLLSMYILRHMNCIDHYALKSCKI